METFEFAHLSRTWYDEKNEIVNLQKGHVMIATEFSQCKNSSRNDPIKIDGSDIEIVYTFFEPSDTSSEWTLTDFIILFGHSMEFLRPSLIWLASHKASF